MSGKDKMYKFIKRIEISNLLTKFIKDVFNYDYLEEYNYIFRIINTDNEIIIDIYDNVSKHRFHKYIYNFKDIEYDVVEYYEDEVFVKKISVLNVSKNDSNLLKIARLFGMRDDLMVGYASSFLDSVFVEIIKDIIK